MPRMAHPGAAWTYPPSEDHVELEGGEPTPRGDRDRQRAPEPSPPHRNRADAAPPAQRHTQPTMRRPASRAAAALSHESCSVLGGCGSSVLSRDSASRGGSSRRPRRCRRRCRRRCSWCAPPGRARCRHSRRPAGGFPVSSTGPETDEWLHRGSGEHSHEPQFPRLFHAGWRDSRRPTGTCDPGQLQRRRDLGLPGRPGNSWLQTGQFDSPEWR